MDSNFRVDIFTSFSILGALDGPELLANFRGELVYVRN